MVEQNAKRKSKLIQLFIVLGIVVLIGSSFGINVLGARKHPGVPEKLMEMRLGNYVSGSEALSQVNQLHGTGIQITGAIIADYSHDFNPYHKSNDERVDVWIGKTSTVADANVLVSQMYQAVQEGKRNTPFSNPRKVTVDGQELAQLDGPGGTHFFYAAAQPTPRIIWLTIKSANPDAVLSEVLKDF